MVGRAGGTDDDGKWAVGTAARGSQRAVVWPVSARSEPSRVIEESLSLLVCLEARCVSADNGLSGVRQ
jgi:hypothetical protein